MKVLSIGNIESIQHEYINFTGEWAEAFGTPERSGCWIIYGKSGQGKSSFALQLARELDRLGMRVLFLTLEMGTCADFQADLKTVGIRNGVSRMTFADSCTIEELDDYLGKQRSADVVFIDSVQYFEKQCGATSEGIIRLRKKYPRKIFIYISHVEGKEVEGKTAYEVKRDSYKRIYVEGWKASYIGRGKGGPRGYFVVWPDGYRNYWLKNKINEENNGENQENDRDKIN